MLLVTHTPADEHDPTKDCPWPGTLNPMLAAPLAAAMTSPTITDGSSDHRPIIKVCGMREADNIRAVEEAGADEMGFIFCPASPRYVAEKPDYLPEQCLRVGVFVDADIDTIIAKQAAFNLDIIQLHGHETPDFCSTLRTMLPEGISLMKMLPICTANDLQQTEIYDEVVDLYLLEPKVKAMGMNHYGGSGQHFDWRLLDAYQSPHPFLLSGGIGPDDAASLSQLEHPNLLGFDLNSRFEIRPALKDADKIKTFIQTIRPQA